MSLILELFSLVFRVCRGIILSRIQINVPILGLPTSPHKASSLLKVGGFVLVLLSALDLGLHSSASCSPFPQESYCFFVSSLVLKLLVLVIEPYLLKLLLMDLCRWVVVEVVRFPGKTIDCCSRHRLLHSREVSRESRSESGSFSLSKGL